MHRLEFSVLLCLGLVGIVLARLFLLPFAKALQIRRGYSDEFVTDLTVAVPLGAFVLVLIASLMWWAQ